MVKCKDCGLLGIRDGYTDGDVVEASEFSRETGKHNSGPAKFVCGASSPDFPVITHASIDRIFDIGPEKEEAIQANLDAITADHECSSRQRCRPGNAPKEIEEMVTKDAFNKLQIDFQQWQKDHAGDMKNLTRQIGALKETHHQENRTDTQWRFWLTLGVSILALIASLSAHL